jgi:hypothetical protein
MEPALRRMHLARRELRDSFPGMRTVTEIAAQYGFWQFGRFAGEYKSLFGKRRPPPSVARASSNGRETAFSVFLPKLHSAELGASRRI